MTEVNVAEAIKKTRPPARVASGNGYEVEQDGVVYRPHAGEEVRFIGEPSNEFVRNSLRYQFLGTLALKESRGVRALSEDEHAELWELIDAIRSELVTHIESWTWTDFRGEAMSEPDENAIARLPLVELFYLTAEFQSYAVETGSV